MRTLQLYIAGKRVDLFKDESVELTQTIKNVRDIAKIFTEFTQTFAVPASKKNNKIFEHYYNFHVTNGFDARIKENSAIELNDLPFKEGKIRLEGVDLKNNVAHTYRLTFFGNAVNLKDILGEQQLSGLDFSSNFSREYSYQNVYNQMQFTSYGDMMIPLITHTDRMYYNSNPNAAGYGNVYGSLPGTANGINWNQFKYAIRLQSIISAIEAKYDLTFSDDFFNLTNENGWATLYMWLHRKSGPVVAGAQLEVPYTLIGPLSSTNQQLNASYAITGGIYANTAITSNSVQTLSLLRMEFNIRPNNATDVWGLQVYRDATLILQLDNQQGNQAFTIYAGQSGILDNAAYTFQFTSATNVVFPPGTNTQGIFIRLWSRRTYTQSGIIFDENDDWFNTNTFQTNLDIEFNASQQMPKMKVIDFLSGLFKMFNLVAYVENDIIVVKTLDDYYEASTTIYNIDKYLDTEKSVVDAALPFKQIDFTYKGLGSFLAKQFNQLTNGGWGSMSFTLDGNIFDAPSEAYKIVLPFEHFQFERLYDQNSNPPTATGIQWGYSVNEDQQPYIGAPLLFYGVIQENSEAIRLRNPATSSPGVTITDYMIPSNSFRLDPTVSEYNIHFQNELNEYLANEPGGLANDFTKTLFDAEYKTYIQEVFNNSMRLTKVTAYLPMKIYYNLQLNDLIEINQQTYKINSLKTNLTTGKTDFELLNTTI
tara:strand:+ start:2945 stop:5065 length:2121 start_codon:yes stop_codon:yes gene_type:complete